MSILYSFSIYTNAKALFLIKILNYVAPLYLKITLQYNFLRFHTEAKIIPPVKAVCPVLPPGKSHSGRATGPSSSSFFFPLCLLYLYLVIYSPALFGPDLM